MDMYSKVRCSILVFRFEGGGFELIALPDILPSFQIRRGWHTFGYANDLHISMCAGHTFVTIPGWT